MKREFLEGLGLSKEVIDKVLDENSADIGKAKGDTAALESKQKDLEKEIEGYKAQIKDRDKQLADLKKSSGDNEEMQKQIEQLQAENKRAKEDHEAELKQLKIDSAVTAALASAKAKNATAVKALLDLKDAKIAEDGTVVGLSEQISKLTKGEDTKFLFDNEGLKIKGAKPGEPGDNKPKGITKEDFNKMGYKERVELYNTNKEVYDALAGTSDE